MNGDGAPPRHLLEEYRAAQESAHHHDNLIWTTSGIVWAGNFVLLGYAVDRSFPQADRLVPFGCLLGFLLTLAMWRVAFVWNEVKNVKYQRCREIETQFGMRQHRNVEAIYPQGEMKVWYAMVSAAIAAAWIALFIHGLCH